MCSKFYLKKKFFNVYLFLRQRETEHEWGKGRERGGHRIWSRLQALSRQHRARHGARTHRPRDRDLSRSWTLNGLSHPGTPEKKLMFILESVRASTSGGGAETERETQNPNQAPGSELSAQSLTWGLNWWDHDLSWSRTLNRLSHPGAPVNEFLNKSNTLGMYVDYSGKKISWASTLCEIYLLLCPQQAM